jgi:hypothetical protein
MKRGRRWGRPGALLALLAVVLAAGALVLLSNPRHRAFYFSGGAPSAPAPDERVGALRRPAFRLPVPPRLGGAGDMPEISPVAAVSPGRHVPQADADGRILVPVADRVPDTLPGEGIPAGWELKEFAGRAAIELVRADPGIAVRLRSAQASFALYRDVIVDLREFPLLAWQWKVVKLPPAGDVRQAVTDDQAAQVYVIFPRWPAPLASSEVIGYVWDSRAPVGTQLTSPKASNVRIFVVESGTARLDSWQRQERNVAADYVALFGRQPPRVGQVAVMIDSNDTRADAETLFADLAFSRTHGDRTEKPTSMLR